MMQNFTQKLFISFKISFYCCFGFRRNLELPHFLQKKFYNIDNRTRKGSIWSKENKWPRISAAADMLPFQLLLFEKINVIAVICQMR